MRHTGNGPYYLGGFQLAYTNRSMPYLVSNKGLQVRFIRVSLAAAPLLCVIEFSPR